jgi:cobalamin biosynthesis Mg chelatase CobN
MTKRRQRRVAAAASAAATASTTTTAEHKNQTTTKQPQQQKQQMQKKKKPALMEQLVKTPLTSSVLKRYAMLYCVAVLLAAALFYALRLFMIQQREDKLRYGKAPKTEL